MQPLIRKINLANATGDELRQLLRREWIVTNGLGGYSSATISGSVAWRYHGLLIAALPAPLGRMVMLNHLAEYLRLPDGRAIQICEEESTQPNDGLATRSYLAEFRMENQLPVWIFQVEGGLIEKRLLLLRRQHTVHITFRLLSKQESVQLELRPSVHFRSHEDLVTDGSAQGYRISILGDRYEVSANDHL